MSDGNAHAVLSDGAVPVGTFPYLGFTPARWRWVSCVNACA